MSDPNMDEKLMQARLARTTSVFYDKDYWDKYWSERFKVQYSLSDPSVVGENEKKFAWLQKRFDFKSVLDVGCSFGFFVAAMREKGYDAWGIDVSDYALSKVPQGNEKFVMNAPATKLPFKDDEIDVVCAFDVLEHLFIEEIMQARDEIVRVAKKGILIKVPAQGYLGPQDIVDRSGLGLDKSHISIYPWSFWARIFEKDNKFFLFNCSMWRAYEFPGTDIETWLTWKKVE